MRMRTLNRVWVFLFMRTCAPVIRNTSDGGVATKYIAGAFPF